MDDLTKAFQNKLLVDQDRFCSFCGKTFRSSLARQKFCSPTCRYDDKQLNFYTRKKTKNIKKVTRTESNPNPSNGNENPDIKNPLE